MVPHRYVDQSIDELLAAGLEAGDLVIDGGNSNYKLSRQRAGRLLADDIHFVDCGTSGGVWGLENGYSLMVGGSREAVALLQPALRSLAPSPDTGWGHVGPAGAGHYVKMVHNGIEYGLMQAYAEGFELMQSHEEMALDLQQIATIWQHGSVVRSWLLDLIAEALGDPAQMAGLSDYVDDSGEGRWTVEDGIDNAVPTPVLALALQMRFRSRQDPSYAGKLLNAMRAGFGGHQIRKSDSGDDAA
jgi:6-phosphogluconate dehydrogenase